MKRPFLFLLFCTLGLACQSQSQSRVTYYDEEDGLPHGHVTQLLQDELGFMWFSTWNGLCRYDGYEFRTFKSRVGDGCNMATDRFRDIALRPDGKMLCRVDDDYYLFDTRTYRFSNMTAEEVSHAADEIKQYRKSIGLKSAGNTINFAYDDAQGNHWETTGKGLSKETAVVQHTQRLAIEPRAEVKCLFTDSRQRYWVCTKDDAAIRVYALADDRLLGYLGTDGRLHPQYTTFGSPIYCMYESADGTLWMGSKPDGLFRLQETASGMFKIARFTDLPHQNVYSIAEDREGRLWVSTMGGGLCYTDQLLADNPRFRVPRNYPKDVAQRVRYLFFADQGRILMAAATDGLLVAPLEKDAENMRFHRHHRESDRAESLSSSATMDITMDESGHYYVSTESGGVNRIEGNDLLADQLSFRHYTAGNHLLPSDVVMSLTNMGKGRTMVVSGHLVTLVDSANRYRVLDARYFNGDYRFNESHPQALHGDRWLFGLTDGAFITSTAQMYQQAYQPRVVLTGISIQGGEDNWTIAYADTILLQPHERSFTLHFAAIDYSAPERISYAFRLKPNEHWNYIGRDRSATLLDLSPGTYLMELRSTNSDGQWLDNVRQLTIIVKPTFWESALGRTLIALIIIATLAAIAFTYLYIRRIKRQQHEALEAYLALLEKKESRHEDRHLKVVTDDPMMQRVMQFIEQNLSNSDAGVGDMAAAAATSRSGLQRKLKQTMGITPQDLLREARIKHACQLLAETDKTIAEVAYACGFSDPKYFSRCFKQSIGQSPSEFKSDI